MNFLNAEIPDTDSSDEDYVPPSKPPSSNVLSIRKKRPQPISKFDDDDDDDDDDGDGDGDDNEIEGEDDGEEEEEEGNFGEDAYEQQARLLASSADGAGPSSAGTAGASSARAGASFSAGASVSSSAGAGTALVRGLGPSSAGAARASSVGGAEGGATDMSVVSLEENIGSSTTGAAASNTTASKGVAEAVLEVRTGDAVQSGKGEAVNGDGEKAVASAGTEATENGGVAKEVGEKETESFIPIGDVVKEERRVEHIGGDERGDEVRVVKKRRVEEGKNKSEIDDIWAEMNRPAKAGIVEKESVKDDATLMGWLGGSSVRKESKPFKVKLLGDLEEEIKEEERIEQEKRRVLEERQPRYTGLEAVLNAVKGAKKEGVLTKTREVWNDFKSKDEEVEAELEAYKKDKDRYTGRVAFLAKSDVRQWKYEQANKRTRR